MKTTSESPRVRILRLGDDRPTLPLIEGDGVARAIVWPGIGAEHRSLHEIVLAPGSSTVPQRHPSEAVYHLTVGGGVVRDLDTGETADLRVGSMIHVDEGSGYQFVAGPEGAELIGGPCPPDPAIYADHGA